eukprot:gene6018-4322_t
MSMLSLTRLVTCGLSLSLSDRTHSGPCHRIKEFIYLHSPAQLSLGRTGPSSPTRMVEVSHHALAAVQEVISSRGGPTLSVARDGSGLPLTLQVGRVSAPLTVLGSIVGDKEGRLAAHSPGLPGAFPLTLEELGRLRCRMTMPETKSVAPSPELGAACLLEAVLHAPTHAETDCLDTFYRLARRRHFSLLGMEELLRIGSTINPEALQLSFPYHCGGVQARKEYFDILNDVVCLYGAHAMHRAKILSRYGLAACVGVRMDDSLGVPALYWHPSGAPAACCAPLLHSCGTVAVGMVELEYNGPTNTSELLGTTPPSRYLAATGPAEYDTTVWLTRALFGVQPGEPWEGWQAAVSDEPLEVHGVQYNAVSNEFELFFARAAHDVIPQLSRLSPGNSSRELRLLLSFSVSALTTHSCHIICPTTKNFADFFFFFLLAVSFSFCSFLCNILTNALKYILKPTYIYIYIYIYIY